MGQAAFTQAAKVAAKMAVGAAGAGLSGIGMKRALDYIENDGSPGSAGPGGAKRARRTGPDAARSARVRGGPYSRTIPPMRTARFWGASEGLAQHLKSPPSAKKKSSFYYRNGKRVYTMPKRKAPSYKRSGKRPAYSRTVSAPVARAKVGGVSGGARVTSKTAFGGEIRVSHRELVRDINGTVNFFNLASLGSGFDTTINPGNADLFPFLSTLAQQYQKYYIHSLKFSYQPACSASTDGTVVLAVDYEPDDPPSGSKTAMMAKPRAQRTAPWQERSMSANASLLMNNAAKYVAASGAARPDGTSQYDAGNFEIATSGMAATTAIGELVVEYSISLLSPTILASSIGAPPESSCVSFLSATATTTGQVLETLISDDALRNSYHGEPILVYDAQLTAGDIALSAAGNVISKAPYNNAKNAERAQYAYFTADATVLPGISQCIAFKTPGAYQVSIASQRGHTNNQVVNKSVVLGATSANGMATGGVDRIWWIDVPEFATMQMPNVLGFHSAALGELSTYTFIVQTTVPWAIATFAQTDFSYNGGVGAHALRITPVDLHSTGTPQGGNTQYKHQIYGAL